MTNTREAVVAMARSKRGVMESPPGSNRTEFGRWYGFDGVYWCAIYVSWVLAMVGNKSGYRFASTAASVAWARRVGRLRPVRDARPGDVLVKLYTAYTGHTGVSIINEGDTQVTDEGNTGGSDRDGGAVMERRRQTSFWDYCIGIDYDGASTPPVGTPPSTGARCMDPAGHPLLRAGAKGAPVNHLQFLLIRGGHPIKGDGVFGEVTKAAVINFQANQAHIEADGVVGNQTWTHLHAHIDGLRIS